MDEKAAVLSELETRALPLQVALPIIPLSFIAVVSGYALVQSEGLRQNMAVTSWFIFWSILIAGLLITTFFSDMRIDQEWIF